MKKLLIASVTVMVIGALMLLFSAPAPALAKPLKFKAVAFLPVNNANVAGFKIFIEKINNKFKDQIEIELIGGPEVTPPFQLHEAVKKGVIDMAAAKGFGLHQGAVKFELCANRC